jgi:hypothetical protein
MSDHCVGSGTGVGHMRLPLPLCGVRCAVCGVRCAVCGVRCAVCGVRCAVCGVRCAVCGLHFAPFPFPRPCPHVPCSSLVLLHPTPGGRFPDVAALGHNFGVVVVGQLNTVDGTSASSPSFAGMVRSVAAALVRAYAHCRAREAHLFPFHPAIALLPLLTPHPACFASPLTGSRVGCSGRGRPVGEPASVPARPSAPPSLGSMLVSCVVVGAGR